MALGSNCTGNDPLPVLSAVLVAGAWGLGLGPSFRVALWLPLLPLGGGRAEPWALSRGRGGGGVEAKGSGFPGETWWLMSPCFSFRSFGNQGSWVPPYSSVLC